jgi:GTP-binding protein Era
VGKSTLTNKLVGRKIAIVSSKPQTTRTRITGILNQDSCQYVFLDTPGLHKPRSRLGDYMVKVVTDTVAEVDVAMVVVEPIPNVGGPEETLIKQLKESGIPGILVINKMDTVKKEELLAVIAAYAEKFEWSAVIPASAKHSDNLDVILAELDKFSLEGPQLFPDDMVSDQPERQMVAEVIREKMLRLLDREVPHGVAVGVENMEYTNNGVCRIHATIYCEKASHKGIIIGKGGEMLKKIGQYARADLEQDLECKVFLDLWIKVKEGWRNNQFQMRNFGYQDQ